MTELVTVVTPVEVVGVENLSPNFVRIELGGEGLAEFGVDGPTLDQRIKLIFPSPGHDVPDLSGAGNDWYTVWTQLPENERGSMRTYTIRELRGEGVAKRLVVDFVLHLAPGFTGPAADWAAAAKVGDRVIVAGPRLGVAWGGIEYDAGAAERIVLAGDETAAPAICGILAAAPADSRGAAFIEVPTAEDVVPVEAPRGVEVTWLPRNGDEVGAHLISSVLAHLGTSQHETVTDDEVDDVWETPTYSSSEEELASSVPGIPGLYVWIAGESKVVTTLRRNLVNDLKIDRKQVAFMGYWRRGVAMKG